MEDGSDGASRQEALSQAVWTVYGAELAEFVTVRKACVAQLRAAGDRAAAKEVAALRKPSVSAAAVNAVVRAEDPVVSLLVNVGTRLRHAQAALDAAGMAALRGERDEVLAAWVTAARAHAPGKTLTSAVEAEVRSTAVAALADAQAAEVATSGTLTRALSYSGFGEVDVADAVARTSTGVVLTRIAGGRDEHGEPEGEGELDDQIDGDGEPDGEAEARGEAADEGTGDDDAGEDDASGDERVAELERALDEAEKDVAAVRAHRQEAAEAAEAAEREAAVAAEQVAQAERLLAGARSQLASSTSTHERLLTTLEEAESELRDARRRRDRAREALEEAEDG